MTDVRDFLFTWHQVTRLSRLLTMGLPSIAWKSRDHVFMSPSSLGLRIVSPPMDINRASLVISNNSCAGGLWHGYTEGQVDALEWAPHKFRNFACIVAVKTGDGKWHVTYTPSPNADAKAAYDDALSRAINYSPTGQSFNERLELRRMLRSHAKNYPDSGRFIQRCYEELVQGFRESPETPYAFIQSGTIRTRLKKRGREWIEKAWPHGVQQAQQQATA